MRLITNTQVAIVKALIWTGDLLYLVTVFWGASSGDAKPEAVTAVYHCCGEQYHFILKNGETMTFTAVALVAFCIYRNCWCHQTKYKSLLWVVALNHRYRKSSKILQQHFSYERQHSKECFWILHRSCCKPTAAGLEFPGGMSLTGTAVGFELEPSVVLSLFFI